MEKVLLTGGAGFIGSFLSEKLLALNYQVVCIDNLITGQIKNIEHLSSNKNFIFMEADAIDKKTYQQPAISKTPFKYILHFASPAGPNPGSTKSYMRYPIETYLINSIATHYLLELAEKDKAKFIFASTSEIYGDPKEHPQKETYFGYVNPVGPRSCYDESKRFGEMAVAAFSRKKNLSYNIIRIFNTYGPRMNPDDGRAIPLFINQALKNQDLTIYGNGEQTRSFCYVDDLVKGILMIMKNGHPNEVYNLGNPEEITIKEIADKILKFTGSGAKIAFTEKLEDDPQKRCPNINKIKAHLGWRPETALEQGLLKTIAYFKQTTHH